MRIALIGRTQWLYETGLALVAAGHHIGAVVTAPAAPEYTRGEEDFRLLAEKWACPFLSARTLTEDQAKNALRGNDIGVSINWVSLLRSETLDLFPRGVLNAHLGDLPRYRGNACPNWAIIQDEADVALSIHFMEDGALDCGRIVHQERFTLGSETYITDLYAWAERVIPYAVVTSIATLERDPEHLMKVACPDGLQAFRCYPRTPEDGYIDWSKSAASIHRLIRATSSPFSGAYTYADIHGSLERISILKAQVVPGDNADLAVSGQVLENDSSNGQSIVACGSGRLALRQCRYSSGKTFAPGQEWNRFRPRLGLRAEDMIWLLNSGKLRFSSNNDENE